MRKFIQVLLIITLAPIYAIDDVFKAGKNYEKTGELHEQEKLLDIRIKEICTELERLHTLRDIQSSISLSPDKTVFRSGKDENGEYIEMLAFMPVTGTYDRARTVGTDSKAMRLYFSGRNLTMIKTIFDDVNYQDQSRYQTQMVHPAPVKGSPDEIQITHSFSMSDDALKTRPAYKQTLRYFENDSSNPTRVLFKRDFYVPNLVLFESLFRQTFDLQKRDATGKDFYTIYRLKRSLR